jgi:hypothetical protein
MKRNVDLPIFVVGSSSRSSNTTGVSVDQKAPVWPPIPPGRNSGNPAQMVKSFAEMSRAGPVVFQAHACKGGRERKQLTPRTRAAAPQRGTMRRGGHRRRRDDGTMGRRQHDEIHHGPHHLLSRHGHAVPPDCMRRSSTSARWDWQTPSLKRQPCRLLSFRNRLRRTPCRQTQGPPCQQPFPAALPGLVRDRLQHARRCRPCIPRLRALGL